MTDRPVILWTADVDGWAYHNRVRTMRAAMPQYEHRVLMPDRVPPCAWSRLCSQAAVVVCQGVKWPLRFKNNGAALNNLVVRLDSMRIDINGVYIDYFTEAMAGGDSMAG